MGGDIDIISVHPSDTYYVTKDNQSSTIHITSPLFWRYTNYLIVMEK